MRLNYDDDDKVEVQMSPLIDCVFLLLILLFVYCDNHGFLACPCSGKA